MKLKVVIRAVVALVGCSLGGLARAAENATCVVSTVEERLTAEHLLADPADAATQPIKIRVVAGTYLLKDSFRIMRSDVTLIGEKGAKFLLANNVNEPVIAVGTQQEVAG